MQARRNQRSALELAGSGTIAGTTIAGSGSMGATGSLMLGLAWIILVSAGWLLAPAAFAQTKPGVELEGAIAKEQVDGDLQSAIAAYQKIAANSSAPRDVRAKALLHLAGCYEKLGQQAQGVYRQIVRDFGDQPAATQARARLAAYRTQQASPSTELKPERLTANTPELTIQAAGLSPNGESIAYSDQLGIHVRSLASGETRLLPGTQSHVFVQWMPDGDSVQTQVQDTVGEIITTNISLRGGPPAPVSVRFVASPDRSQRATPSGDSLTLSIQDANGGNARELWRAAGKGTLDQFQWRSNSKQIAILSSDKGENGYQGPSTLELVEADGRKRTRVLIPTARSLNIGSIVWAAPNRMIVAVNKDTGPNQYESNLWELRLNSDGSPAAGLRKLTSWADFPIRPASLSTDGKRLVFIRSFRQRDVYVAPLMAGGTVMGTPRRLTLDLGDDYPSDWTRDSKTVILTSTRNGSQTIFRQDLDKQTAEQIARLLGRQALARVTPDGASLLFMSLDAARTPQSQQLMHAPITGGAAEPVPNTPNPGWYYRCVPAGVCLNAQQPDASGFVISELDLTKGSGREIYRDSHMEHPDISPDGKWIADTTESGTGAKIVIRSFVTGAVDREIPVRGSAKLMTFGYAPDGKGFFASDMWLTEVRELYIDLSGNVSVLYREPASIWGIWGIPSPDGKYLALVLVTDDSNVYTVEHF